MIINGNSEFIPLADETVDLIVTSPPYDGLRDYKGYSFLFENIAKELVRVLVPGGVIVWVVGDQTVDGSETGTSFRQALYFMQQGLLLHDTMIYQKHNFANPSNTRYHQVFEYMFVFSKGKPKTFNPIMDKKNKLAGQYGSWGVNTTRQKDGTLVERDRVIVKEMGMRSNVWVFKSGTAGTTDPLAYEHPASFPEELAQDHILSWSNPGDLVLDPFAGSGTTLKMAKILGRRYVGIDISYEYCVLSQRRAESILI